MFLHKDRPLLGEIHGLGSMDHINDIEKRKIFSEISETFSFTVKYNGFPIDDLPRDCQLIISQGHIGAVNNFNNGIILANSVSPIQVHETNFIKNIPMSKLCGIFSEGILNWKKLEGPDADVTIYTHAGPGQWMNFRSLVKSMSNIDPEGVVSLQKRIIKCENYELIAQMAAKDPGALVMGLRQYDAVGLSLVSVDGKICNISLGMSQYPLSEKIYIQWKDTMISAKVAKIFAEEYLRRCVGQMKTKPKEEVISSLMNQIESTIAIGKAKGLQSHH